MGTYRHLKLAKDYDKTVSNEYFLNQGVGKDLSSLTWFDLSKLTPKAEPRDYFGNKIDLLSVMIYSSGLVFKDVMLATGERDILSKLSHQLSYHRSHTFGRNESVH